MTTTNQFTKLVFECHKPKPGFDMRLTIWSNGGQHVAIGAPTLGDLRLRWKEITKTDLVDSLVQHVVVTRMDAPPEMLEAAKRISQGKKKGGH